MNENRVQLSVVGAKKKSVVCSHSTQTSVWNTFFSSLHLMLKWRENVFKWLPPTQLEFLIVITWKVFTIRLLQLSRTRTRATEWMFHSWNSCGENKHPKSVHWAAPHTPNFFYVWNYPRSFMKSHIQLLTVVGIPSVRWRGRSSFLISTSLSQDDDGPRAWRWWWWWKKEKKF